MMMQKYRLNRFERLCRRYVPFMVRQSLYKAYKAGKRGIFMLVLWIVKQATIIRAYVVGSYRYCFFFKVGHVYVNNYNDVYYKYTGDCTFKEGNKIVDTGFLAIEMPGNAVIFNIFGMGFFNWQEYRK